MSLTRSTSLRLAALAIAAALAGCGGSAPPDLLITGTAALGAPVVNGAVVVTCAKGTGTATSTGTGSYSVVVIAGEGPCLLKITPPGGVPMYSFSTGTTTEFTANITPLTNMLVTYMMNVPGATASSPETWFALPAVQSFLAVPAAVDARIVGDFLPLIKTIAASGGVTLTLNNADFLRTPFVANPTTSPLDAALVQLKTANVVTSTGAPTAATTMTVTSSAKTAKPVPPTTTGSGGG